MLTFFKAILQKDWKKVERSIGGLKFAVFIISLFSLFMIVGTFLESYFGTDFGNRFIYKRWPFMLLQFCMFCSILFATFLRLPPKKRLYGFYVIHSGLITVGVGSFVTYYAGIDGSIFLPPNEPSREVILGDDIISIHFVDENKMVEKQLPYTPFKTVLNSEYAGIKFLEYFPYSEKSFSWKKSKSTYNNAVHTSKYLISNAFANQEVTLSLHPESRDFQSSASMGPLTIHYMPKELAPCFADDGKSKLIIWDQSSNHCSTPERSSIPIKTTSEKKRFLAFKENGKIYRFFPDFSPWPLDEKFQVIRGAKKRIFSKKIFEEKPNLFAFGKKLAFYNKEKEKWFLKSFSENKTQDLPWMSSTITLLSHNKNEVPTLIPEYTYPIQKSGKLIKGKEKAIRIEIRGEAYWLTDSRPVTLGIDGKKVIFQIKRKSVTLPFEFVLTDFKMKKDPGTDRPASYESFVRLHTPKGPVDHHIYMNNPLKYRGFTFYQASYSEGQDGRYSSTLSVNIDPGRPIKYFGCLLLILGSLWHYQITVRRKKLKSPNSPLEGEKMGTS